MLATPVSVDSFPMHSGDGLISPKSISRLYLGASCLKGGQFAMSEIPAVCTGFT